MKTNKILSIVTCNKNDGYTDFTLERTKFILNYFGFVAQQLAIYDEIEYILVDWGSEEMLSSYFSEEVSKYKFIKFLNVSPSYTDLFDLKFDTSRALNLGIDHSEGEHILILSPDQFIPLSVFSNLINLITQPEKHGISGDEYKAVPRKFLEQNFNYFENCMRKANKFLTSLNYSMNPYHEQKVNVGSGIGGMMLKKHQWKIIGGLKETRFHNRGQDPAVMFETSKFWRHIDTSTFGIFILKLPRTKGGHRFDQVEKAKIIEGESIEIISSNAIKQNELVLIDHLNVNNHVKRHMDDNNWVPVFEEPTNFKSISNILNMTSLVPIFDVDLDTVDIFVTKIIRKLIEKEKINSIIFDITQAIRFVTFLTKYYRDITINIILSENHSIDPKSKIKADRVLRHAMKSGHYGHIKVFEKCNDIYASISAREKHLIILDDSKVSVFDDLKHDFGDNSIFIVRDICSIGFPRVVYHFINTTEHLSSPKIMENQRIKIIIFSMIVLRKLKWFVSNMLRI